MTSQTWSWDAVKGLVAAVEGELQGRLLPAGFTKSERPALRAQWLASNRALDLVLWPSLHRVDLRVDENVITLTGVDQVTVFPDTEVQFTREEPRAFLFVTRAGRWACNA